MPLISENKPDTESADRSDISLIAESHVDVVEDLKGFAPIETIAAFAGLLTAPELQANCYRLEAMLHLATVFCRGRAQPTPAVAASIFARLGSGHCGRVEDPAEDVFACLVNNAFGNFRVFGGLREGTGFYLQRILDVLEHTPQEDPFVEIRESVRCLLKISDEVAARNGVIENVLGQEIPQEVLPMAVARRLPELSRFVQFDEQDLKKLEISQGQLDPFVFDPNIRSTLLGRDIGDTLLERYPLIFHQGSFYLAAPTAVAGAITKFVIEEMALMGLTNAFAKELATEFQDLIYDTPLFGHDAGPGIDLRQVGGCSFGYQVAEIDPGRFLQIVLIVEGFDGFANGGLNGIHDICGDILQEIQAAIEAAYSDVRKTLNFRGGMTLVALCGVGRGFSLSLPDPLPGRWEIVALPAYDLITLGWLTGFTLLEFWRINDAVKRLAALGVTLINMSGFVNLVAMTRKYNGHLVSDGELPPDFAEGDAPRLILMPHNAHREIRHSVLDEWNPRRVLDVSGNWIRVRKIGHSRFRDDSNALTYVSERDLSHGRLRGVHVTSSRAWWIEIDAPADAPRHMVFEYWKILCGWVGKLAGPLERAYSEIPAGSICLRVTFAKIFGTIRGMVAPANAAEIRSLIKASAIVGSRLASVTVGAGFDDGLLQPENLAERILVEFLVSAAAIIAGRSDDKVTQQAIVDEVCPDNDARGIHRFEARTFRDFVRDKLAEEPIFADPIDHASGLIGLGRKVHGKGVLSEIVGVSECTSYLNQVVFVLLDEICRDLKQLDRRQFVRAVFHNHETAASHRDHWGRTSRALIAMHSDKESALRTIVEQNARLNACSIASRILVEASISECPLESGKLPGRLEVSRMIAKMMTVFQFGGWSDAIHWGAMEPKLKITALGDIHANVSFMQTVYEPFGRVGGRVRVEQAVEGYADLYTSGHTQPALETVIEPQFLAAWAKEFSVSLIGMRAFVGLLQDIALQEEAVFVELRRSRLASLLSEVAEISPKQALLALDFQTSAPRTGWRVAPEGFAPKDWYPWRFRRRLAILRRPLVQIDLSEDPAIICAPGLIGDALLSMVTWFHKGEIPQARSREMGKWLGHANNFHRLAFNETVAEKLRQLGWQVRKEVRLKQIFGRPLDRDYGDIDVLAWNPESGRVLAVECKDLQTHTTFGEVAEQLHDFRGETLSNGKPDHLKRHLDRIGILLANETTVGKFLSLSFPPKIEGHLVFKNPVPMGFAWDSMAGRVKLSLFNELDQL